MLWTTAGTATLLRLNFTASGISRIPDANSVFLTIRDGVGAVVPGYEDLPLVTTTTQFDYTVPAEVNTLAGTEPENRFVQVRYTVGGEAFNLPLTYSVTEFIPTTVTPPQVATLLGLNPFAELPSVDVDVPTAYYSLLDKVPTLATDLITAGIRGIKANDAIALQAALALAISLPQRLAQMTKDEGSTFQRPTKLDPYKLQDQLNQKLVDLIADLNAVSLDTALAQPLFVVGTRTDAFTGA